MLEKYNGSFWSVCALNLLCLLLIVFLISTQVEAQKTQTGYVELLLKNIINNAPESTWIGDNFKSSLHSLLDDS